MDSLGFFEFVLVVSYWKECLEFFYLKFINKSEVFILLMVLISICNVIKKIKYIEEEGGGKKF